MPFVTRIVQVQHINFTLLCAYCQVIVKCFILFCINNSLLHLPDDFQFRKCPVMPVVIVVRGVLFIVSEIFPEILRLRRGHYPQPQNLPAVLPDLLHFPSQRKSLLLWTSPHRFRYPRSQWSALLESQDVLLNGKSSALFIPSAVNSAFPATEVVV